MALSIRAKRSRYYLLGSIALVVQVIFNSFPVSRVSHKELFLLQIPQRENGSQKIGEVECVQSVVNQSQLLFRQTAHPASQPARQPQQKLTTKRQAKAAQFVGAVSLGKCGAR